MTLCDSTAQQDSYVLALAGEGPALFAILNILEREDFRRAFPGVCVAGWVSDLKDETDQEKTSPLPEAIKKYTRYNGIQELFSAHPEVGLALDLSPDGRFLKDLHQVAPSGTTVACSEAVLHFCTAAEEGSLSIDGEDRLRKSEGLFTLLMDQVKGDIIILDKNGIIVDVNRRAAENRNLKRNEILGKPFQIMDLQDEEVKAEDASVYEKARATAQQTESVDMRITDSGKVRYLHSICIPVTGKPGSDPQYFFLRRDVTEQYQLEKRLQQTERMAAIGELSTYMAHEIRNPLFAIGGFANALLRDPSLGDSAREKARIIFDESRRLDVILTKILNFARPSEQTMGVFDAVSVISQTLDLMTMGSDERKIHSDLHIAPNLPMVQGNAENLKQCLVNLVKNALEAMPEGGKLTIQAARDNGYVRINVIDTGEGIPPELQEQVFNPFFSTRHGGAGLGLAMVRKSVGEMGGKVVLISKKGQGTKVSLFLPVALEVQTEDDPKTP